MKELTGVCLKCMGCNRLENPNFERSTRVQILHIRTDKHRTNEDGGIR